MQKLLEKALRESALLRTLVQHMERMSKLLSAIPQFRHNQPRPTKQLKNPPWDTLRELESLSDLRNAEMKSLALGADDNEEMLVPMFMIGNVRGLSKTPPEVENKAGKDFQLLYLLIDCSGSMDRIPRIGAACAILCNRLVAVAKNQAHLFYRFFDNNPHPVTEVNSRSAATAALNHVMNFNYSGGGTKFNNAIGGSVTDIKKMMSERTNFIAPQLTIVTDGEDSVSMTLEQMDGIVLNVILVDGARNAGLETLAKGTGGCYICIDSDGNVSEVG